MNLILVLIVIAGGGLLIVLLGLLTFSGTFAAAGMAILFYAAWGPAGLVPALVFLLLSSLWTRWPGRTRGRERRRNLLQVLANGLPGSLFALFEIISHNGLWGLMMTASFAAAAADTWSTEWGRSLGGAPVSLRTFKATGAGESGAVSALGCLASFAGAGSVAAASRFAAGFSACETWTVLYAGFFGGIVDSLVGAWIQGHWRRPDGTWTESRKEAGSEASPTRGIAWVNNDVVNLLAAGAGALAALSIRSVWPG